MKKGLVGIVTLLVLVLASYFGTGMLIERHIREDLKLLNQTSSVQVDLDDYKRGLLTSTGNLTVNIHVPERESTSGGVKPPQDFSHSTPLVIHHGPFIFAKDSPIFGLGYAKAKVELPKELVDKMKESIDVAESMPVMDVTFFLSYLTNSELKVSVPPFKMQGKGKQEGKFSWLGLNSQFNVTAKGKSVIGDTTIDGLTFSSPMISGSIGKLVTNYHVTLSDSGLWLGKGDFSFPSMEVTQNGKKKIELVDLKGDSKASVADGLFKQVTQISMNKLSIDNQNYGPANLNISIRKLDANVLAEINKEVSKINDADDKERQRMMFSLLPKLMALVAKGAELEISDVYFVMPQGKVEANAKVSMPEGQVQNPMMLMQKITANALVKVPKALVKDALSTVLSKKMQSKKMMQQVLAEQMQHQNQSSPSDATTTTPSTTTPVQLTPEQMQTQVTTKVDQQLASLVQAGVLVEEGDYYRVKFDFNNAQLTVNGKPFNPAMLR